MLAHNQNHVHLFLDQSGLSQYSITFLAGDASPRKYYRITTQDRSYVLMDSPSADSNQSFMAIDKVLIDHGFSAPQVLASTQGLILLEDLGDTTFTYMLKQSPERQPELYDLATQTTLALGQNISSQPPAVPIYSLEKFLEGVLTFLDWYYPTTHGHDIAPEGRDSFTDLWTALYSEFTTLPQGLMLRDFHVDNLIYLKDRTPPEACGLLDFQDACWGPAVYDFISLIDDVRLDLPDDLVNRCWQHYLDAVPALNITLAKALSVSRLTRILGVFVRLAQQDGKTHYLQHMPRIWRLMDQNFQDPGLNPLKGWFDQWVSIRKVQK